MENKIYVEMNDVEYDKFRYMKSHSSLSDYTMDELANALLEAIRQNRGQISSDTVVDDIYGGSKKVTVGKFTKLPYTIVISLEKKVS